MRDTYRVFCLDGAAVSCSGPLSFGEAKDRLTGIAATRAPVMACEADLLRWEGGDVGTTLSHLGRLACVAAWRARLANGDRLT